MIEQRLAEIEARAKAATPGPWVSDEDTIHSITVYANIVAECPDAKDTPESAAKWDDNRAFVAAARTDIPRLVAALRVAVQGRTFSELETIAAALRGE